MKINYLLFVALCVFLGTINQVSAQTLSVNSPDGHTRLEIKTNDARQLVYRVAINNAPQMAWSALALKLSNNVTIGSQTVILSNTKTTKNETFYWPIGENDNIINHYNQIDVVCHSGMVNFHVIGRVFNGSVAFRYQLTNAGNLVIVKEGTSFNFLKPFVVFQYNEESVFTPTAIDTLKHSCDFPSVLKFGNGYAVINEADNADYTKGALVRGETTNSLTVAFNKDSVKLSNDYLTPWRTISFASDATGLHQYSDLILKLCDGVQQVPAWIKPGKLIRAQINTQSGLDCVDFAVKQHYQYVLFDAGWYGKEFSSVSDPRQYIAAVDIPKVIEYAKQKNIGVILYVNYVGLRKYLDEILPLYKKWGVAGMKFGFVNGLKQEGITFVVSAVKKAYDMGFVIDIHDNYKPTGLSHTYPGLLTQEGIRGNEHVPDAYHNTMLPFTRFLSGAADYTFCFPPPNSPNVVKGRHLPVSKAHQLALSVTCFSPLQSMLWYGEPKDYTNNQEIEFYKLVPTVWNRSLYLKGEPGKYASVARKKDGKWYIGNIAGTDDWNDNIALDFLDKGKSYKATFYEDDGAGGISKRTINVTSKDNIQVSLKATTGQAVIVE